MRTYSRVAFEEAREAWRDFGPEWNRLRSLAAERGVIYPPKGTRHDDRNADEPSQRAIVYRALEENPAELERIVRRSSSWSQVVDRIIGLESRLREDADLRASDDEWERRDEPTHRDAVQALGAVLRRLGDSVS